MVLTEQDYQLIAEIQGGLPLSSHPYAEVGAHIGLDEGEVIERIGLMQESGVIKRMGWWCATMSWVTKPMPWWCGMSRITNSMLRVKHWVKSPVSPSAISAHADCRSGPTTSSP